MGRLRKKWRNFYTSIFGVNKNDFFFRYRAMTWSVAIGTFVSILIFVICLQIDLGNQRREFQWLALSEQSFLQKELDDLQNSLEDSYFRLKSLRSVSVEQIEVMFRNEMRNRFFGLSFFLPRRDQAPSSSSDFYLLSGQTALMSTEGLPAVSDFKEFRPQMVVLPNSHPLYRIGALLIALPFPEQGVLYLSLDLERILQRVTDRKVFSQTAEVFIFNKDRLVVSSQRSNETNYWSSLVEVQPASLKKFSAFYDESYLYLLGDEWQCILSPAQKYLSSVFSFYPWLFLGACLIVTGLIAFAFYQMIASREEIEETVKIRTKELQEKTDELGRLNKELNDFAYVVSHDLQEPIRTISSFLDVFISERGSSITAEETHLLDRIKSASVRMHRLLKDILRYSRLSMHASNFQTVELDVLLQEVWDDLNAKVSETRAILKIEGSLPSVYGDPVQLRQLFTNLINNSIKFRKAAMSPEIDVVAFSVPGRRMSGLRIKDNGIGFDSKYAELIFKPFHRLHREEEIEGSGIGLAICRKIVERHGGEIHAESRKGEGSVFNIILKSSLRETEISKKNVA